MFAMQRRDLRVCVLILANTVPVMAQNGNSALFGYISGIQSAVSVIESINSAQAKQTSPSSIAASTTAAATTSSPASTTDQSSSATSPTSTDRAVETGASSGPDQHTRIIVIAVCVVIGVLFLIAIGLGILCCLRRRHRHERTVTPVDGDEVRSWRKSWRGKRRSRSSYGEKEMVVTPAAPLIGAGAGAGAGARAASTNRAQSLTARHRDNLNRQNPFVPAPPPTRKPVPTSREALEVGAAGAALSAGAYSAHKHHEDGRNQKLLNSHPGFEVRDSNAQARIVTGAGALNRDSTVSLPTNHNNPERPPTPFGWGGFSTNKDVAPSYDGHDDHHGVEMAAGLGVLGTGAAAAHRKRKSNQNRLSSPPPDHSGSSNYNSISSSSTLNNFPPVRNGGPVSHTGGHVLANNDQRFFRPTMQTMPADGYATSNFADCDRPIRPKTGHNSGHAIDSELAGLAIGAGAMHDHNESHSDEDKRRMSGLSRRLSYERGLTAQYNEFGKSAASRNEEIPLAPTRSSIVDSCNGGNNAGLIAGAAATPIAAGIISPRQRKHRSLPLDNIESDEHAPRELRHTHRSYSPLQRPLSVRNGYPDSVQGQPQAAEPYLETIGSPYQPDSYSGPYHNGAIKTNNRSRNLNFCQDAGAAGVASAAPELAHNRRRNRSQPASNDSTVQRLQPIQHSGSETTFLPNPTYGANPAPTHISPPEPVGTITLHDSNPRLSGPLEPAHLANLTSFSPSEDMRRSLIARERRFSAGANASSNTGFRRHRQIPFPPEDSFIPPTPAIPGRSPRRSLDRPTPSPHKLVLSNTDQAPGAWNSSSITDSEGSGESWRSAKQDLPEPPSVPWNENYVVTGGQRRGSGEPGRRNGEIRRMSGSPRRSGGNGNGSPYGSPYRGEPSVNGMPVARSGNDSPRRARFRGEGDERANTMVRDSGFDFGWAEGGR